MLRYSQRKPRKPFIFWDDYERLILSTKIQDAHKAIKMLKAIKMIG